MITSEKVKEHHEKVNLETKEQIDNETLWQSRVANENGKFVLENKWNVRTHEQKSCNCESTFFTRYNKGAALPKAIWIKQKK